MDPLGWNFVMTLRICPSPGVVPDTASGEVGPKDPGVNRVVD
jgi:hypothetical protein